MLGHAGAVNGGWLAADPGSDGVAGLAEVWRGIRRQDVFPSRPLVGLLGFLGKRRNLVPPSGLRRLLRTHLDFDELEQAPVPLHVVVSDVISGQDERISTGNAVDAILASAAIPAVFPPVMIEGRLAMDGGVVNNTPISHAADLGATVIWVLSTGYACDLEEAPTSALGMALHALSLTINQRLAVDVDRYEREIDLRVVPTLCPLDVAPTDFSHSTSLIERAAESTRTWLERTAFGVEGEPGPQMGQAAMFGLHRHR